MLKRHTPSLESVWAEWEREKRAAKRRAARGPQPERRRIPDNSEPWLKHPPRTISDLYYISDRVAEVVGKMGAESEEFLIRLGERSRVLLLGGLAVIAHGLSRTTEDADVWLDSSTTLPEWEEILRECLPVREGIYFWDLLKREQVSAADFGAVVEDLGVVRIGGMDRYVDVFRRPNELHEEDFDVAWDAAKPHLGKIRLMDETFLIVTKENSERDRDRTDIGFLESKLRGFYQSRLAIRDAAEASVLFSRYLDHATCEAALRNPDAAVRDLGMTGLQELAEGGNPFAIAALRRLEG